MRHLALGYAFVLLSIEINGFDIFPNIIGYGLILTALVSLSERSPAFRDGRIPAGIGCVVSILDLIPSLGGGSTFFALVLGLVSFLLSWWLLYSTFTGLSELADEMEQDRLKEEILTKRQWFIILQFVLTGLLLLYLMIPFLAYPLIIATWIYAIWLLWFLRRAGETLADFEEGWQMGTDR